MILSVTSSAQLAVLKFVGDAPSLAAKLMPLDLPVAAQQPPGSVASLCLDSKAGKLAVAFLGDPQPTVCVFALQTSPACVAHLVARLTPPGNTVSQKSASQLGPGLSLRSRVAHDGVNRSAQTLGSVLAVAWPSGGVGIYNV